MRRLFGVCWTTFVLRSLWIADFRECRNPNIWKNPTNFFLRRVITKTFYNCKLKIPANAWKYPNNIFHRNNIFQKLKNILINRKNAKWDFQNFQKIRIFIGAIFRLGKISDILWWYNWILLEFCRWRSRNRACSGNSLYHHYIIIIITISSLD